MYMVHNMILIFSQVCKKESYTLTLVLPNVQCCKSERNILHHSNHTHTYTHSPGSSFENTHTHTHIHPEKDMKTFYLVWHTNAYMYKHTRLQAYTYTHKLWFTKTEFIHKEVIWAVLTTGCVKVTGRPPVLLPITEGRAPAQQLEIAKPIPNSNHPLNLIHNGLVH